MQNKDWFLTIFSFRISQGDFFSTDVNFCFKLQSEKIIQDKKKFDLYAAY